MKRFYAVLFTTLTFSGSIFANEPGGATPAGRTSGTHATDSASNAASSNTVSGSKTVPAARAWQKEEDRIMGHIRTGKLTAMKNTSASIMSLFHDSILTDGSVNPVWHGEYFPATNGGPQVHFGVRCVFNNEDNTNTDNDLTVFANDIRPLLGNLQVNGHDFTTIRTAAMVHGNMTFEFDVDNNLHVKAWLVTADSAALPWVPVTRKEYLSEARKELENLKDVVIADVRGKIHVRPAAEQEAEKQAMLDQLKSTYSGAELEARTRVYLNNYIKDEDYVTQTITRNVAGYNATIALIDGFLRNSTAQELARPAVVSVKAEDFQGFEDGKTGTTTLVRMNPAYFNGGDEQAPKCLLICWRYNPTETLAAGIDHQLDENFDSQVFQSLLAK